MNFFSKLGSNKPQVEESSGMPLIESPKCLIRIGNRICEGKRLDINCKGGHGRSTLFVAYDLMY